MLNLTTTQNLQQHVSALAKKQYAYNEELTNVQKLYIQRANEANERVFKRTNVAVCGYLASMITWWDETEEELNNSTYDDVVHSMQISGW